MIAVVMVLRATVAKSASSDWKLWTGSPSGLVLLSASEPRPE